MRVLSIDIPWGIPGNRKFVGAAMAEVDNGQLVDLWGDGDVAIVDSVPFAPAVELAIPDAQVEVDGLIQNGVGAGRDRQADVDGPFKYPQFQHPVARMAYTRSLREAFHQLAGAIGIGTAAVDIVTVDIPLVTAETVAQLVPPEPDRTAQFRPVERAFTGRAFIPGQDGWIQFARFQAGVMNCWRPGYAVCETARLVFNAGVAVESFPQLVLGSLAEFSAAHDVQLIHRLSAHKGPNNVQREVGQGVLLGQITAFLGGSPIRWVNENLPFTAKADAYDALLGLLPGLVLAGYNPPGDATASWQNAIVLRNFASNDCPDMPMRQPGQGREAPLHGSRPWINEFPQFVDGIDDSGVLTLDLGMWQ